MVDPSAKNAMSLRERKKQRTRRMLIDAAVDLCLRQGYEATTIEQIASAADISTRTFSRYFATKDAVFIAVLDDFADEIVAELTTQPWDLGPLEALRAAHVAVLERLSKRPLERMSAERFAMMMRIVYSHDTLRQAAIDYRSPATMELLAAHMGVPVDDGRLNLAIALFSTTIVNACSDLIAEPGVRPRPEAVMDRLDDALGQVADFTAKLNVR
ncbi:TetR/AcrR family transcriptional regulator [Mycobacterium sp. URHB0044]|uniref:TetR/AcrR family transcriptional regulator n=1 Tax=Mycobacterium sp. URHB0044 TaxID=1380386 RepID=UPI00068411A1|nr:TetR family transcriptional regulator [Mycobacterium sp. URHB0044]